MNFYHGTDYQKLHSIKANNFYPSENPDDWLGKGVYFFTEGISCPIENAEEWAKASAYCKKTRANKYTNFVILMATIDTSKIFDTTTNDGLVVFNKLRKETYEKIMPLITRKPANVQNKILWDLMAELLESDVVIHNLYIKSIFERKHQVSSNVPNCTVACVKNVSIIKLDSIQEVRSGLVA